jgi:PilZ domain
MPDQPKNEDLSRHTPPRENASAAEADRRKTRRHPFFLAAEAEEIDSKTKLQTRTSDLSLGGCYLDAMSPFPPGTRIHLRLTRDNQTFRGRGVVVYSHLNMGMGVAFLEADTESRALLARWVRELEGEETPQVSPDLGSSVEVSEVAVSAPPAPMDKLVKLLLLKGVITHEEARKLTN